MTIYCKGGESKERSLSLLITADGDAASWICFRAKCGWRGSTQAFAGVKSTYGKMNQIPKVKQTREIVEQTLGLEPLCSERSGSKSITEMEGDRPLNRRVRDDGGVYQQEEYILSSTPLFIFSAVGVSESKMHRKLAFRVHTS
ncbi:unnamed protein product [Ilex paraguariensis]|uniref:Uncharacterized protein n=1 Tax=Ilex paraguariensis TaxID=185542 RepID=A0ABC8S2M8_9AQUA